MAAQAAPEMRLADRRKLLLTLGFPFALLLLSSLVAWPWRAFDLPGVLGALTPLSFVLLAVTVGTSTYALRRQLPLSMITWLPAGQGAIVLLATGLLAGGAQEQLTALAFIVAYGLIFLIVLGITTAIAAHGGSVAIAFISFFVFTQAARFPVFEVEGAVATNASLLTLGAAVLGSRRDGADGLARAKVGGGGGRVGDGDGTLDRGADPRTRPARRLAGPDLGGLVQHGGIRRAGRSLAHVRGHPTGHGRSAHPLPAGAVPRAAGATGRSVRNRRETTIRCGRCASCAPAQAKRTPHPKTTPQIASSGAYAMRAPRVTLQAQLLHS